MNGGKEMHRVTKVAVVVGLVCATGYTMYSIGYKRAGSSTPANTSHASTSERVSQRSTAASTPAPASSASVPRPFSRSEWGYRWDPSKPGVAANEADAVWLESRGFPGPDVEDHLRRLSIQELEALAARGNQAAVAILAYKLAASGTSRERVLQLLSRSANEGSVYALKTAGDIFMTVDGYRDPAMASAYYGLQARAGDQSGFAQRFVLSNQLNSTQRLQSDLMQEMLWQNINSAAQYPAGLDARPGFNEFLSKGLGPIPTQEE